MNIEGLSEKTLQAMIERGFITRLGDVYRVTAGQLAQLEGFRDKKIKNLLDSVSASKTTTLARVINALGIANIGKKASGVLANSGLELFDLDVEQLTGLEDFGEVMAHSVVEYFKNNSDEVKDLLQHLTIEQKRIVDGVLSGVSVCITGTLVQYTRAQLAEVLVDLGANVVDSVSKTTNVLIVGESAGGKLEKAQKLGIKIVQENRLAEFLGSGKI
jgi:DNA ligase (NAD+)